MDKLKSASALIDRFERESTLLPAEAEKLVSEILRACGHKVTDQGFVSGNQRVDCFFEADIDGRRQRIAVEVKFTKAPLGLSQSVEQASLRSRKICSHEQLLRKLRAAVKSSKINPYGLPLSATISFPMLITAGTHLTSWDCSSPLTKYSSSAAKSVGSRHPGSLRLPEVTPS
jgi:hypothetical protein